LAVDKDAAFLCVVVTEEKAQDCGFTAAAGTNDSDLFAGGDGEVEILDDVAGGTVAEGDIFELDLTLAEEERWGVGLVYDLYIDLLQVK
jgi:hypothetical protein